MLTLYFIILGVITITTIFYYIDSIEKQIEDIKIQLIKDDCKRIIELCEEILKKITV